MTISSETRKAGPYTGNGLTTSFSFAFKVFTTADVLVVRTDLSAFETTLTLNTDYSVTLNSNQDSNPGGTVVLPTALTTGYLLTLSSQVGALQSTDLTNQGGFYPSVLNTALDKLTILVQQLKEQVGRAVKTDISSSVTPAQLIATLTTNAANAVASAASAATSAANALASQVAAAASAAAALVSQNSASSSASSASASASTATTQAALATTNGAAQVSLATTQANNSATSATNSANSATAAAASAAAALTSKNNAATSETNAANSATAAAGSATSAAAQLTSFKNAYYGPLATNPTTRPDSSAMQAGDEYYNTSSKSLQVYNGTSWGAAGVVFNPIQQSFSGNGSTTAFTLSQAPGVVAALLVSIGGVNQTAGVDYTLSGTTLTFTSAPPAGTNNINTVNFGVAGTIGVPANASVTPASLTSGAPSWSSGGSLALPGATSQTGTGISFPGTQNISSDANTLDDYEEGTWTPTLTGGGTWPTVSSYNNQYGHYRKIGSLVFVTFYVYITSGKVSGGTGAVQISGLPFTTKGGSNSAFNIIPQGYCNVNGTVNSQDAGGSPRWQAVVDNGNYLTLYGTQSSAWGTGVYELAGSGCYMAYGQ